MQHLLPVACSGKAVVAVVEERVALVALVVRAVAAQVVAVARVVAAHTQ